MARVEIGNAGPLIGEGQAHAATRAVAQHLDAQRPAAAIVEGVAGDLAGGGDDLGLVDQAEPGSDSARPHRLPHPHHVVGRAQRHGFIRLDVHPGLLAIDDAPDQGEPLVDVQRGAHAGQRQAQLDQRDRHRRPHADDHRHRIQHARHGSDIVEHAPDEGIDDLQRRDVDHHAARAVGDDPVGQIVLQRHGQPVVHVHLDGDQQAVADLQDRDLGHTSIPAVRRRTLPDRRRPCLCGAAPAPRHRPSSPWRSRSARRRDARSSARSAGGCR